MLNNFLTGIEQFATDQTSPSSLGETNIARAICFICLSLVLSFNFQ